ncbi:MAG TPA: hypothetical protein VFB30_00535, partial [Spirochaetia bacterium]|nr:hypothetical protein [Spirochaetia bacterium]
MLGHNGFPFLAVDSFPLPLPVPLAYVGLGPGQEFIPYFFALLGVIGTAIVAVLQWPVSALLRWLRAKGGP